VKEDKAARPVTWADDATIGATGHIPLFLAGGVPPLWIEPALIVTEETGFFVEYFV